jgi:hypothetical protein
MHKRRGAPVPRTRTKMHQRSIELFSPIAKQQYTHPHAHRPPLVHSHSHSHMVHAQLLHLSSVDQSICPDCLYRHPIWKKIEADAEVMEALKQREENLILEQQQEVDAINDELAHRIGAEEADVDDDQPDGAAGEQHHVDVEESPVLSPRMVNEDGVEMSVQRHSPLVAPSRRVSSSDMNVIVEPPVLHEVSTSESDAGHEPIMIHLEAEDEPTIDQPPSDATTAIAQTSVPPSIRK